MNITLLQSQLLFIGWNQIKLLVARCRIFLANARYLVKIVLIYFTSYRHIDVFPILSLPARSLSFDNSMSRFVWSQRDLQCECRFHFFRLLILSHKSWLYKFLCTKKIFATGSRKIVRKNLSSNMNYKG